MGGECRLSREHRCYITLCPPSPLPPTDSVAMRLTHLDLVARYFRDSTFKALQTIEQAVEKHGLTMIETALRWTTHHSALKVKDGNDGIIIGVSSMEQLGNNLDNLEKGPLPEDLVKSLDEAWNISKVDSVPYWHGEVKYHYDPRQVLYAPGTK